MNANQPQFTLFSKKNFKWSANAAIQNEIQIRYMLKDWHWFFYPHAKLLYCLKLILLVHGSFPCLCVYICMQFIVIDTFDLRKTFIRVYFVHKFFWMHFCFWKLVKLLPFVCLACRLLFYLYRILDSEIGDGAVTFFNQSIDRCVINLCIYKYYK